MGGRAPEVGFNTAVLYWELKAQGYEGSYPPGALSAFLASGTQERGDLDRALRDGAWGAGAAVDWSSALVWLGQQRVSVFISEVFTKVQNIGEWYAPLNRYIPYPGSTKSTPPSGSYDMWSYQPFADSTAYRQNMEAWLDWCPGTWCF